ncbi:MAG: TadE family protein [Firmicutes bacterium]|nr:TadE family protein [Bacillota bacterium]
MVLLNRYIKNNRGQALVEFALMLPVLLLLVVGVMEFGLIINQYMVLAEAAREGARSAALGDSDTAITTVVKTAASQIDITQLTITISPTTRIRGSRVTVTVAKPAQAITQLMSPFFPPGFMVQGAATMRVE